MTWTSLIIAIVVLSILLVVKRGPRISIKTAATYLHRGALLIDVRSAGEFTAGHLPNSINIPLSEIETIIDRKTSDKQQVLLLHCQTGTRSAEALKKLTTLGYVHAFDLGSYGRAAKIFGSR
ncbi:MAG: rhodanese-like domain-containing protein [Terracidiphilus sp.]|jgi:phage shock protein E